MRSFSGLITYNSSRIAIWLDPLNDAFKTGTGYQTRQSLIAIGSGGLLGLGLGKSRQKFCSCPRSTTTAFSPSSARSWA